MKAKMELDIPNDFVINPSITLCPGVRPNASAGNTSAKKGTKKAAPLMPTVFTTVAITMATGNIHQNVQ